MRVITGGEAKVVVQHDAVLRVWVEAEGRDREPVDCDAILVAVGRIANTDGLDLEKAGVAFTSRGVTVDEKLRTSQRHIYAAGDVTGPPHFTHLADRHARTVVRNILFPWWSVRVDASALPWCTFTSPEVARVGLNEQDAVRAGFAYDLYKLPMNQVDRAVVESEDLGFAKVLVARGSDRILGATIVSERAGDLIHEIALAMTAGPGSLRDRADHPRVSHFLRDPAPARRRPAAVASDPSGEKTLRRNLQVGSAMRAGNRFLTPAILLAAVLGAAAAWRLLPLQTWLGTLEEQAASRGPTGLVLYGAIYVVAVLLFVPGIVLTLGAGLLFGFARGFVLVSMASTVAAALAFGIARYLARERVQRWARSRPEFEAIDRAIGEKGWKIVALLRLSPLVPFSLSNYLYGLTSVRFGPYVLTSWLAMLPATLVYVWLGAAGRAVGTGTRRTPAEWALLAAGLAATVAVTIYLTRIARRELEKLQIAKAKGETA